MSAKRGQLFGPDNGNWNGGRSVASNGYVLIRVGKDHHLADVRGYAYEHRLVAEAKIGRRLRKSEIVHHVDHDRKNNAPQNLEVTNRRHHLAKHRTCERGLRNPGQRNPVVVCACRCGAKFRRFDSSNRPRRFVSGHNMSRSQ